MSLWSITLQVSKLREIIKNSVQWVLPFWLLNGVLMVVLACRYWQWMNIESSFTSWSYVISTQIGLFGSFALLLFLISVMTFFSFYFQICISFISGFLASVLLLIDTFVYDQFRFHMNWFVLDFFLEGENVIKLSWLTWLLITGVLVGLFGLQLVFLWIARHIKFRYNKTSIFFIFMCLVYSQIMHVVKEAHYDVVIPGYTPCFPCYFPLTSKRTLEGLGWVKPTEAKQDMIKFSNQAADRLRYPVEPMQYEKQKQFKNIVFLVIDACRYDTFSKKNMPNVYEVSQSSSTFHEHRSGGNSTLSGIFSLFYGLPRTYWESFLGKQRRPIMMEVLADKHYDFKILSSAPLNSPPFDRTVFSGIKSLRLQTPAKGSVACDKKITDDFIEYIKNRDVNTPFFGFLFFDSAHRIDFPKSMDPPFTPYWERVDHLSLNKDFDPEPYHNRYRNAVYYTDQLIGEIIFALKKYNYTEKTVLVITSDHGEEFNDNKQNYWGHGSNFSDVQLHVPLVVFIPGQKKEDIHWRTSHFDVPVTLLENVLGVTSNANSYSVGHNLYEQLPLRDWLIVGSYTHYAIVGKDEINIVYPGGIVRTTNGQLQNKTNRSLQGDSLRKILLQQSYFYK